MRKLAAALAALMMVCSLAACGKTPVPAETPVTDPAPIAEPQEDLPAEQPAEAPAEQPAKQIEPEIAPEPEENAEPQPYTGVFSDEPLTLAADIEEVVSYEIAVPQVTLDNADAARYINEGFTALADSLVQYAQETVYKTAQEKQTIGFLECDYTITIDGGQLIVNYSRTERYAGEDLATTSSRTFRFDVMTGEQVVTE